MLLTFQKEYIGREFRFGKMETLILILAVASGFFSFVLSRTSFDAYFSVVLVTGAMSGLLFWIGFGIRIFGKKKKIKIILNDSTLEIVSIPDSLPLYAISKNDVKDFLAVYSSRNARYELFQIRSHSGQFFRFKLGRQDEKDFYETCVRLGFPIAHRLSF